jgi:hypothetical protein
MVVGRDNQQKLLRNGESPGRQTEAALRSHKTRLAMKDCLNSMYLVTTATTSVTLTAPRPAPPSRHPARLLQPARRWKALPQPAAPRWRIPPPPGGPPAWPEPLQNS